MNLNIEKSSSKKNAHSTQLEIIEFNKMVKELDFVDVFRQFYPDKFENFTYWSYKYNARAKNNGWRVDYFMVSRRFMKNIKGMKHHTDILGSDHCPIELELEF